jgi:hypothetical protein
MMVFCKRFTGKVKITDQILRAFPDRAKKKQTLTALSSFNNRPRELRQEKKENLNSLQG